MATQSEFEKLVTEKLNAQGWEFKKAHVQEVLDVVAEAAHEVIGQGGPVKLRNLITINVRQTPARAKRHGRNPATGEAITIAAKPASTRLTATFAKPSKEALP